MTGIPSHLVPSAERHMPVWVSPRATTLQIMRAAGWTVENWVRAWRDVESQWPIVFNADLTDRDPGDDGDE